MRAIVDRVSLEVDLPLLSVAGFSIILVGGTSVGGVFWWDLNTRFSEFSGCLFVLSSILAFCSGSLTRVCVGFGVFGKFKPMSVFDASDSSEEISVPLYYCISPIQVDSVCLIFVSIL